MNGLIIKNQWLEKILHNFKVLEIRGSKTSNLEKYIYLLESGTRRIRGLCRITDCIPITEEFWNTNRQKHQVDISYEELLKRYPHPYAWVLDSVLPADFLQYFYKHPKGAVIWVKDIFPVDEDLEDDFLINRLKELELLQLEDNWSSYHYECLKAEELIAKDELNRRGIKY